MKTYISDIIPRIQRYSEKLDNLTLLRNQHWIVLDEIQNSKSVYIFRDFNELLISNNGKVERCKWEYLGNNSLLIERKNETFLFKHGFFDENILALKIDGEENYAVLFNETKSLKEINSIEDVNSYLLDKYLNKAVKQIDSKDKAISLHRKAKFGEKGYFIERTNKSWSFKTGSYVEYEVKFENEMFGQIHQTLKKDRFSFTTKDDVRHFETLEKAVYGLKEYLNSKI